MSVTAPDPNAPTEGEVQELAKRARSYERLESYFAGDCAIPEAIQRARITEAYRMLMAFSQTHYAKLIVRSATGRMSIEGLSSASDREAARRGYAIWRANHLGAESRRLHDIVLTHGRGFANIWLPDGTDMPTVTYETPDMMLVRYRPGSRYERERAVRLWKEGDRYLATVSTDQFLYKWRSNEGSGPWVRRMEADEPWPLPIPGNPGVVPVVEIATKGTIKSGYRYGVKAAGDFEHLTGLLDRINILEFLRLVIAFAQGFPVRVVIGEEIQYRQIVQDGVLRDDTGQPIAPFKLMADVVAQLENPDARLAEFAAADIERFGRAMDRDVETLAGLSMTPSYFMRSMPIQNVAADAVRAADVPLITRVTDHQPFVDDGHEETLRTALAFQNVVLPDDAQAQWGDVERYSLAERADAFQKMTGGAAVPWQIGAELAMGASAEQVERWETMGATNALLNTPPEDGEGAEA